MTRRVVLHLSVDSSQVDRGFRHASRSAGHFERDISRAGRGVIAATIGFKGLGRSLALASGTFVGVASITAAIKSSVGAAVEYEDSLKRITALTGLSAEQTHEFGQEILKLAPAVGKAPKELGDALYFIASAGLRGKDALDTLRASAQASAAGLGETQVIADAVTSALNSYGKGNLSAAHATDVLIATVREGKTQAASLAPVLGNVLPVAAKLGVSFEDVGAAMAGQTRAGFDAATAATNLTAVFSTLLKQAPKTEQGLAKVGLSTAVLRKELKERGLNATLQTMQMAFKGNAAAMAQAFPNIRALRVLLALTGTSAAQTSRIFASLHGSTGSLARAFRIAQQDPAFRFQKLSAALDGLRIRIGSALLPTVLRVTNRMSGWLSKTKNQEQLTRSLTRIVKTAVTGIESLARASGRVAGAVGGWKNAIVVATGAWAGFKAGAIGAAAASSAANLVAAGVVSSAWKAALISTGFGALAVAAGVAAAYVITHWSKVKGWFHSFVVTLRSGFRILWDVIKIGAYQAALSVVEPFSHLPAFLGGWARKAKVSLEQGLSGIQADMQSNVDSIVETWRDGGARAGSAFAQASAKVMAQNIRQNIPGLVPSIVPGFQTTRPRKTTRGTGGTGAGTGAATGSYGSPVAPGKPRDISGAAGGTPAWKKAIERTIDQFGIMLDKAGWTKTLKDDESIIRRVIAYLKVQQGLHRKDLDIQKDLVQYQGQLLDLQKQERDATQQRIDEFKQQIGSLFQGPVLAPTDAQTKARLGVLGPDPNALLRDLKGQNAAFRQFMQSIAALAKRGAPKGLITELQGLGPDATVEIKALASAPKKLLKQYFAAFAQRNKEAIQAASVTISAKSVTVKGLVSPEMAGLRHMASGGVVMGPTRALIGEAGPEAVIPLRRGLGGGTIVVPVYLDGRQIARATIPHTQRLARSTATQTRGRQPGQNVFAAG